MVKYQRNLDATFQALADPTRRAILAALMGGQASVSDLAKPYRMSLPGVMKHLRVLERAGLVRQHKQGRSRNCRLVADPLQDAEEWISHYRAFWERQFDALDRYLSERGESQVPQTQPQEETSWPKNKRRRRPRRRLL